MTSHIHVARRRLLTAKQAARRLNVQETTVALWCEHGLISPYEETPEAQSPSRFYESDVCALLARLEQRPPTARDSLTEYRDRPAAPSVAH